MEFDSQILFNFIPLATTISALGIALIIVIQRLKWRWCFNVRCWFCNARNKIYRSEINWWRCSSCEQYNGFSKDGDYKYDIPEQRNKSLNNSAKLYSAPVKIELLSKKNGLCTTCNQNEEFKLYKLRSADSTTWRNSEIQTFKKNLEEKYPLCTKCNIFVKEVLQKQNMWLTQYRMLAFKQKPMKIIVNNSAKIEKFCRIFLIVLSAGVIYYPTYEALAVIGAVLQLIIATTLPISKRNFNLLLTLFWMGIGVLTPFSHLILLRVNLNLPWVVLECVEGYQIIMILSIILGFINIAFKSSLTTYKNMSFKKLNSSNAINHHRETNISNNIDYCTNENSTDKQSAVRRSPINITHLLTTPSPSIDLSASTKTITSPNFRICKSQRSSLSTTFSMANHQIDILESSPKRSLIQDNYIKNKLLNESLKHLSSLSLSGNHQKQMLKNPKIFETKMYGTTSSDLFRRNYSKAASRKFVLAPSKLKSVSQSSWVAGGYWQTGMDSPTLSRSSSQSSGFGSASSIFGPSREPSVVNDVDRYSTMSDATQWCHSAQRQPSISPVNSFCQHPPSSSSSILQTCRLAGPEFTTRCIVTPLPNVMMSVGPCHQASPSSLCQSYHVNEQCLQNRNMNFNMIQRSSEVLPCVNYPSTILTSPILLPALLCGSLVFNMVVFCTVLLR